LAKRNFITQKLIANIVCAFVPSKKLRHKIRNYINSCLIIPPKHYLSICAIAKNEGCYFQEWLEYHLLVGVEKFYIYDNESTDDSRKILEPYIKAGIVEYIYWPGQKQQISTYKNCVARYKYDTEWLAIIDLDEFIVPIETKTIPKFLEKFKHQPCLEINWLLYGSGGYETKTDELVMERFKRRSELNFSTNRHVKTIVNPRLFRHMINPHTVLCLNNRMPVDTNGNPCLLDFPQREPLHDKIRINHYYCKSWEEYQGKSNRGFADQTKEEGQKLKRNSVSFNWHDRNEVLDSTMDKYIEPVKEAIKRRPA